MILVQVKAGSATASQGTVMKKLNMKDPVSPKTESVLSMSLSSKSVSQGPREVPHGNVPWLLSAGWAV